MKKLILSFLFSIFVAFNISIANSTDFTISQISDELFSSKLYDRSYKIDCTVPRSHLRVVKVLHKTMDGKTKKGVLIVNKAIAQDIKEIFEQLYLNNYPIEKIRLVDEYDANDESSMTDNNTSSFNFRFISNTNRVSKHGLGLAVDINPLYNPYVFYVNKKIHVEPVAGATYADRSKKFPYKIDKKDLAYKLFKKRGFIWGGEFSKRKDYQHFEVTDDFVKRLYPSNLKVK